MEKKRIPKLYDDTLRVIVKTVIDELLNDKDFLALLKRKMAEQAEIPART